MKSARILVALLGATIAATAAFAAAPVQSGESSKGQILAGPKGMALYTFKNVSVRWGPQVTRERVRLKV